MRITLLILAMLLPVNAYGQGHYDRFFRDYTIAHFGVTVSPTWTKSVALAESNLRPGVYSHVGAAGLMQFMPATWDWIAPEPWKSLGALNPEAAIFVGAKYLKLLWDRYPKAVKYHRKALTNASYNSGPGNVDKARRLCATGPHLWCGPELWDWPHVEAHLITAPHHQRETIGYVARIRRIQRTLEPF